MHESEVKDFFALLKPRVMTLVVFTGVVGMYLAPGHINPFVAIIATLCIALGSGAAGAINMWYERDIDALMKRTKQRPLPANRMYPQTALEFAIVVAVLSVVLMAVATNLVAAFVLLVAILFYVFIYTIWLKRRTPQNIVIGGAAGSFPPMIGWAAVTGNVSLDSILLFMIIFMWTPPHFWSLALYKNEEYKIAGIPMMPVVAGSEATRRLILIYTIVLVVVSLFPFFVTHLFGGVYLLGSVILGGIFIKNSYILSREYTEEMARKNFKFSLFYLAVLFLLMVIDKALRG